MVIWTFTNSSDTPASFTLAPSAAVADEWSLSDRSQPIPDGIEIQIVPNGKIDAVWMGSEWVYRNGAGTQYRLLDIQCRNARVAGWMSDFQLGATCEGGPITQSRRIEKEERDQPLERCNATFGVVQWYHASFKRAPSTKVPRNSVVA